MKLVNDRVAGITETSLDYALQLSTQGNKSHAICLDCICYDLIITSHFLQDIALEHSNACAGILIYFLIFLPSFRASVTRSPAAANGPRGLNFGDSTGTMDHRYDGPNMITETM